MKTLTLILLLTSILQAQKPIDLRYEFTKKETTIITVIGTAALVTTFALYKVKTVQDSYLKAGVCTGIIFSTAIPIFSNKRNYGRKTKIFKRRNGKICW